MLNLRILSDYIRAQKDTSSAEVEGVCRTFEITGQLYLGEAFRDMGRLGVLGSPGTLESHYLNVLQKGLGPEPPSNRDAHTEHCCVEHGCKYGDPECSVALGLLRQSYCCEACPSEKKKQ